MDSEIGSVNQALSRKYVPTYLFWGFPVLLMLWCLQRLWAKVTYVKTIITSFLIALALSIGLLVTLNPVPPILSILVVALIVGLYFTAVSYLSYKVSRLG
jgi:uncharacterized membrane protein (DUF106 family)